MNQSKYTCKKTSKYLKNMVMMKQLFMKYFKKQMKNYLRRIEMNNNYKNMIEKIMKNKHI